MFVADVAVETDFGGVGAVAVLDGAANGGLLFLATIVRKERVE